MWLISKEINRAGHNYKALALSQILIHATVEMVYNFLKADLFRPLTMLFYPLQYQLAKS